MSGKRIEEIQRDFVKALGRLEEAFQEDATKSSLVIDAAIQRFEFVFELAWKLLKARLQHQGIEAPTPPCCHQRGLPGRIDSRRGSLD